MFIAKADLGLSILIDELDEITRSDAAIITAAISAAEAEAKVYLYDSYDTEVIFAATGAARHQLVVQLVADMAIYFIVARCQAGQDIADREARYKRAVATLKQFQKSETYADLPRRTATKEKKVWFKTNPKRSNYFNTFDETQQM
jgi:hypothetical protein